MELGYEPKQPHQSERSATTLFCLLKKLGELLVPGPGTSSRPWEFLGTPVARGGLTGGEDTRLWKPSSLAADTLNSPELLVSLPSRIGRGQPISCSVEMWPPGGSTKLDW